MDKKVLDMKEKYGVIYKFMFEVLGLEQEEALKNTLKLESAVSKNILERFKSFLVFRSKSLILSEEKLNMTSTEKEGL